MSNDYQGLMGSEGVPFVAPTRKDGIYRDLQNVRMDLLDQAISKAHSNRWNAYNQQLNLESKFDNTSDGAQDLMAIGITIETAKKAVTYWDWVQQGLKDLRYRDKFYPDILRESLELGDPPSHSLHHEESERFFRLAGYHDGFYFNFFRNDKDPKWLREMDRDWNQRKRYFGPPQIPNYPLDLYPL